MVWCSNGRILEHEMAELIWITRRLSLEEIIYIFNKSLHIFLRDYVFDSSDFSRNGFDGNIVRWKVENSLQRISL